MRNFEPTPPGPDTAPVVCTDGWYGHEARKVQEGKLCSDAQYLNDDGTARLQKIQECFGIRTPVQHKREAQRAQGVVLDE